MILILDASKSMKADDGTGRPKFQAAKEALNTLVDELPDDAKVGLRVYGSQVSGTGKEEGCADTRLVSPVVALDREGLKQQIAALSPKGFTPIGASLQGAVKDLGTAKQKTVVLVSDGGDNCAPPQPCGVAKQISKGGIDAQDPGGRLPGEARCAAPAAVHRRGRRRPLRRRRLRPGARGPAAGPDGTRAAALRDRGQAARGHAGARHGQALRGGPVHDRGQRQLARVVLVQGRRGSDPERVRDAARQHAGIPTIFKAEIQNESLEFADSDAESNSGDVLTAISETDVEEGDLRDPPNGRHFVKLEVIPPRARAGPTRWS